MSNDTIRRYISLDRLRVGYDRSNRMVIDGVDLAEFCRNHFPRTDDPSTDLASSRNALVGLVTDVVIGDVMAQVEVVSGRQRVVSIMTVEAARDLELAPGVLAVARVKATDVIVEVPNIDRKGRADLPI